MSGASCTPVLIVTLSVAHVTCELEGPNRSVFLVPRAYNKTYGRFLLCSDDGICPCECNYDLDEGCTCRDIDGSISISITKSPVSLLYPTTYIRNIQYYPTEETIYTDNCKDGPHETIPTCSWLSIGGEIQEDSQVRKLSVFFFVCQLQSM